MIKDKVEILAHWEEDILYKDIKLPAILRLKNCVYRNFYNSDFNRNALIIRDHSICQYCWKKLTSSQITVDHIIPKTQGGANSFINCVISCQKCNSFKRNRTPEQANMILLVKPVAPPPISIIRMPGIAEAWHPDWFNYLKK
jgi:5-methylcytosine-specific restriction endonuclease McrA